MQTKLHQSVQNPQLPSNVSKKLTLSPAKNQSHVIPLDQLMLHLSRYRQLKQLPLNPVSQPKDQLWRQSPCTVRCPNRNVSMDRIQRFKLGSIYYRDNINEQKKIFTESQKPQLMLKNFRRQIQQASHSKHKYSRKFSQVSNQKAKINMKLGKTMPMLNNKFYEVPKKLELKYDRNGTRSTYVGDYDVKTIIDRFRSTKPNFTSSRRMDLGLPLNFNPGPGNYFTKSQQFSASKTYRSRKQKSKMNFYQQTQRHNTTQRVKDIPSQQLSK